MTFVSENFRDDAVKLYHQITYEFEYVDSESVIALIESKFNLLFAKGYRVATENQTEDLKKRINELEES